MFESITQFNSKFDNLFTNVNKKGYACGFFSILTAYNFLKYDCTDKETHENNIGEAIKYTAQKNIVGGINFDNLLNTTSNLNNNNIMSTTVELIKLGILSYQHIFDNNDNSEKYAIIFLKNEKYFVVLVDNLNKIYYLRDCHEHTQYSYDSLDSLIIRLNEAYQFNTNIDLLGDEYIAYSSIEYIKITENFTNKITKDFVIKQEIKNNQENKQENKQENEKINKQENKQLEIEINQEDKKETKQFVLDEEDFYVM
jgi:hypothetical protein